MASHIEKRAAEILADPATRHHAALTELAEHVLKLSAALRLARADLAPCRCPRTRFRHTSTPPMRCSPCRAADAIDNLLRTEPA